MNEKKYFTHNLKLKQITTLLWNFLTKHLIFKLLKMNYEMCFSTYEILYTSIQTLITKNDLLH